MYKCQYCDYQCSLNSELKKHINGTHNGVIYKCNYCRDEFKWKCNLKQHMKKKHDGYHGEIGLSNPLSNKNHFGSGYNVDNIQQVFDIRIKENFRLFVMGPSRCGKTVFVAKLLENIHAFSKLPPMSVLYIYKVWQPKYDEIMSLGVIL